eukprot:Em0013g1013a
MARLNLVLLVKPLQKGACNVHHFQPCTVATVSKSKLLVPCIFLGLEFAHLVAKVQQSVDNCKEHLLVYYVTFQFMDGQTALMMAYDMGHMECVKMLVDKGAQGNMKPGWGVTTLMTASEAGKVEYVKLLLDSGVQVNVQSVWGETALIKAYDKGHMECVKVLLDNGAQVNMKYQYGWTALMKASVAGKVEYVKMLLDRGAEVNMQDNYGWTPLMKTSEAGHMECVKVLLDKGAEVNMQDKWNYEYCLNGGSQQSYMTEGDSKVCPVVNVKILLNGSPSMDVTLFVVLITYLEIADWADPGSTLEVDVLTASDDYWELVTGKISKGAKGPTAIHTKLGWVLCCPIAPNEKEVCEETINTIRFREALMADIERAFLMISVEERDRDFLRFLWVDNIDKGVILKHFIKEMDTML